MKLVNAHIYQKVSLMLSYSIFQYEIGVCENTFKKMSSSDRNETTIIKNAFDAQRHFYFSDFINVLSVKLTLIQPLSLRNLESSYIFKSFLNLIISSLGGALSRLISFSSWTT